MHFIVIPFLFSGGGGGRLFEAGRLLTFSPFRVGLIRGGRLFEVGAYSRWALIRGGCLFEVGAYSRWALIRGWVLNRINTVIKVPILSKFLFSHLILCSIQ